MSSRVLKWLVAISCFPLVIGCVAQRPQVAIINPQLIDQAAAQRMVLPRYAEMVVKANRLGFEMATALLRRFQSGEIALAGVKSSPNGRHFAYTFTEKSPAASAGDTSIMTFSFNPGAELTRSCNEEGLCDVYVRNGVLRFGHATAALGEPTVDDGGVAVRFADNRSRAFDLLFSYPRKEEREADALIAIFLSAFPVLGYQ